MTPSFSFASSASDPCTRFHIWTSRIVVPLAAGALVLALAGCSRGGAAQAGGGGPPPPAVTVQEVRLTSVPVRFEFVGQTAGSKEAEVRARVQGILERRTYQEGARVNAGQTLFVIDARPYAAQVQAAEADLARAQAQAAQARRNLERVKPLADTQAISRREFDEAVSQDEVTAAAIKQAQAQLTQARLNLSYTTVAAPVAGFASRAQKSEGSLVSPGQDSLLTTVSVLDPIHVNFSVSEAEQGRLSRALQVKAPSAPAGDAAGTGKAAPAAGGVPGWAVTLRLSDGTDVPRKGRLGFIDPRVNTATGAYDAQAVLPNADALLRPGQFVRVVLEGPPRSGVVVVPQRAVLDGPQGKFVYVAGKNDKGIDVALPRPVTVGDWVVTDGQQNWIIDKGLKPGDPVIVEGTAKLFPIPGGAPISLGPPPGAGGAGDGKGADGKGMVGKGADDGKSPAAAGGPDAKGAPPAAKK
jgi:membrane fusion protein (multidrug efflux system)